MIEPPSPLPPPETSPAFRRGLDYLYQVRSLAPQPELVSLMHHPQRSAACLWIGEQIEAINAQLQDSVQRCHDCFHPWQQRPVQVFAAPLAASFQLDGVCNLQTQPATILVDVGRVLPADWLALMAHEYAHVQVGTPGHHAEFVATLIHLCRGLGLDLPVPLPSSAADWRTLPTYRPTSDPLRVWLGNLPQGA